MRPRRRPDLFVEKLQAWRSWLGYASVVMAVGLYGSAPDDLGQQLFEGAVIGFFVKAVVAVPIVVVAIVIIAIVSHPLSGSPGSSRPCGRWVCSAPRSDCRGSR